MRNMVEQRRIACRRDGANVVVDLGSPDGSETLMLTTREANALADQLRTDLLNCLEQDRYWDLQALFPEVCDVPLTLQETLDLKIRLDRIVRQHSTIGSSDTSSINWRGEGF